MIEENKVFREEGDVLARYIVDSPPNETVQALYAQAMAKLNIKLDDSERRLWNIARGYPFTLRFIDSGLAVVKPDSALRRKIYTMLAILEASPEYCDQFLPKRNAPLYAVSIVFTAARAVLVAIVGAIAVRLIGVRGR